MKEWHWIILKVPFNLTVLFYDYFIFYMYRLNLFYDMRHSPGYLYNTVTSTNTGNLFIWQIFSECLLWAQN